MRVIEFSRSKEIEKKIKKKLKKIQTIWIRCSLSLVRGKENLDGNIKGVFENKKCVLVLLASKRLPNVYRSWCSTHTHTPFFLFFFKAPHFLYCFKSRNTFSFSFPSSRKNKEKKNQENSKVKKKKKRENKEKTRLNVVSQSKPVDGWILCVIRFHHRIPRDPIALNNKLALRRWPELFVPWASLHHQLSRSRKSRLLIKKETKNKKKLNASR